MAEIDLYEIGVRLLLDDGIIGQIDGVTKQFDALQGVIDKVNESLASTRDAVGDIVGVTGDMAANWRSAASAAGRMADYADRLSHSLAVMPDAPGVPGVPGNDGRPDAVASAAASHGISPWDYIIAGGVGYEAGSAAVKDSYSQAATIQHQAILMENQGASPADMANAIAASQGLQQSLPGLSQEDAMTIIRDTFSQSIGPDGKRNMGEAITVAQQLAQTAYVLQGLGDDDAAAAMFSLVRAGDLRGLMNQRNADGSVNFGPIENFIAGYQSMAQATGGRITPQDYQTILKNAGPEGLMMDDHAMAEAGILSLTMGAPGIGVGINALATQFIGGKMSQAAAARLHEAGLLPDSMFDKNGKILKKYDAGIGQVLLPEGAVKDSAEFQADPFEWIQNVFAPAVAGMNPDDRAQLLAGIYGDMSRTTGARAAAEMIFQEGFLDRQLAGLNGIPSAGQSVANAKNDPTNTATGFINAFDALMAQLGSDAMPTTTAQLKDLTAALNGLTDWAKNNPNAGHDLAMTGETAAETGAAAVAYGAWKIVSKMLGIGSKAGAGTAVGEAGAEGAAVAADAASGPPGWLVALTGAVVLELINTGSFTNNIRHPSARQLLTDPTGGQGPVPVQIVPGPNNAPVPVHVQNPGAVTQTVINQLAKPGMPTGPNGINSTLAVHHPGTDAPGALPQ